MNCHRTEIKSMRSDKEKNIVTPYISIIIPVYNSEMTISRCLDSILNQSLVKEKYEIVIVNDGSTDRTEELCENYKEQYNNIHIISQKNQGVVIARTVGAENASGEYIMSIDSDDSVEEGYLEYIYENLSRQKPDMAVW